MLYVKAITAGVICGALLELAWELTKINNLDLIGSDNFHYCQGFLVAITINLVTQVEAK